MSLLSSRPRSIAAVAVAATALGASPAFAWHRHHYAHAAYAPTYSRAYADPYASPNPYPYRYWGGWQAAVIARRALEMQNAPGVTNELAPDNIATATGGPSGGVPGFSSH